MELEVVNRGRFNLDDKLAGLGTSRVAYKCKRVRTRAYDWLQSTPGSSPL